MELDWSFISQGVTSDMSRTTGPECQDYMSNTRRLLEGVVISALCVWVIQRCRGRLKRIHLPSSYEIEKRHSNGRLGLMLLMTLIFGIEIGFKFANRSMIFILNPCHIQTIVQIYLLAAKPTKITIALFRLQMNNLNGTLLSFLFPEVDCRKMPFEQATYWIQHAMLYIIPVYILKTEAYQVEDLKDYNWSMMGMAVSLLYHFTLLNGISIISGINLNHMLCAAESDPFEGPNYRLAAVIHESLLCPLLNKATVYAFKNANSVQEEANIPFANNNTSRVSPTSHSLSYHRKSESENLSISTTELTQHSVGTQVRVRKRPPKEDNSRLSNESKLNNELHENVRNSKVQKKNKHDRKDDQNKHDKKDDQNKHDKKDKQNKDDRKENQNNRVKKEDRETERQITEKAENSESTVLNRPEPHRVSIQEEL